MAHFGHDRIGAVGIALPKITRMNMDVGDNSAPSLPTMRPQIAKQTAIDFDNASSQCVRIYVVVEDEFFDPPHLSFGSQQESATLALTASASPEFRDTNPPYPCATEDLRRRPEEASHKRCC